MLKATRACLSFSTNTYLEEALAEDSVLQFPERLVRVLSPIEQRRLCDRRKFTPTLFRAGFVFAPVLRGRLIAAELIRRWSLFKQFG